MRSSDHGLYRVLALLALWVLGAACARGPGSEYDPRPLRLVPAWGLSTEAVPVLIEGENFLPLVTQHIGGKEPLSVDDRFEAFLDDVALEEVALEDEHTLRARVPAGLAPGWHTLTVMGPLGERVELPRAYFSSERPLAKLEARAALDRSLVAVGARARLTLTVVNSGGTAALAVTPVPRMEGVGQVEILSSPQPADIGPGASASFVWELAGVAAGDLRLTVEARGQEETTGLELPVPGVDAGPLGVRNRATLSSVIPALPQVINVGQQLDILLEVSNSGDTEARGVRPTGESLGDGRVALVSGPEPASADIPGKGRALFRARVVGTIEGSCVFRAGAGGTDTLDGAPVAASPVDSSPVVVQRPAALAVTLSVPLRARPGSTFPVNMTVKNTGTATALGVVPANPRASNGIVTPASTPVLTPVDLPGGASATFTWSYRATAWGRVSFAASARGTDGNAGSPVTSAESTSGPVSIFEVDALRADPFQDGSSFSQLFSYQGRLVLGPNRSGTRALSVDPDGTVDGDLTFSFPRDTSGSNTSLNTSLSSYSSIGSTGCVAGTASCGPDNEDGRGFFFAGQVGTQEWLGIGGARSKGDLDYVYLTQDTGGQLGMRFVDLSVFLGGQTRGFSAALFFHDRLYLGFPDTGGSRPYLVALRSFPALGPGLDAMLGSDADDLDADSMPGIGVSGTPSNKATVQMIDTLFAFNDRLYVVNNGGCVRSTTATPRSYGVAPVDWVSCTPSSGAWSSRTSRTTAKAADLEPADKAIPQMAVFQGRLYLARNTMVGPQLFACEPAATGSATDCDPGDWSLVAANSTGDTLLTQFDNPANTALTALVATSRSLFVGFDNGSQGAVVMRTSHPKPANRSDFLGSQDCSAAQHPGGCAGLGGAGLGVGATRLFDGMTFGPAGAEAAFLTAGNGTGPVQLLRLTD